jgi:Tol biopolymer transport system component
MRLLATIVLAIVVLAGGFEHPSAQRAGEAERLLASAQRKATVAGDLKGAIDDYKSAAARAGANRALAVQALLGLADSYRKVGDAEAQKVYAQIVKDFADQKDAVAFASAQLGRTGSALTTRTTRVWSIPDGADLNGNVSRDGRYMAFVDWDQQGDLFVRDLQTGTNRRITRGAVSTPGPGGQNEYAQEVVFSRDGRQLAFAWGIQDRAQIRVVRLDGSGIPAHRVLFDGPDAAWIWPEDWSPDGRSIAVGVERRNGTSQIGLLSAETGSLSVLESFEWREFKMAFSPDGRHLAFDVSRADTRAADIFVFATDSRTKLPAVTERSDDRLMGWSPDGTRLIYQSDRRGPPSLWSLRVDKGRGVGEPELLKADFGRHDSLGISGAGTLFYTTFPRLPGSSDITLVPFDTFSGRVVGNPEPVSRNLATATSEPVWSPDGQWLAFKTRPRSAEGAEWNVAFRAASGALIEHRSNMRWFTLVWAPDSEGVLMLGRDPRDRQGVFRLNRQTGTVTALVVAREGEEVFLPMSLTNTHAYYRRFTKATQESVLVERDLTSGAERDLMRAAAASFGLSLSRRLAYAVNAPGTSHSVVVERDLTTGRERDVLHRAYITHIFGLGRRIGEADFGGRGFFGALVADPASQAEVLLSVPLDGGAPRELFRVASPATIGTGPVQFLPNGEAFYARTRPNGRGIDGIEIWRVPLAGGAAERVELNGVEGPISSAVLSRDGRQLALVTATATTRVPHELWALEHFLPAPAPGHPGRAQHTPGGSAP